MHLMWQSPDWLCSRRLNSRKCWYTLGWVRQICCANLNRDAQDVCTAHHLCVTMLVDRPGFSEHSWACLQVIQRKHKDCMVVHGRCVPTQAITAGSIRHPNLLHCLHYAVREGALQHGTPCHQLLHRPHDLAPALHESQCMY